MNLARHYESYRESVKADALEGWVEFSRSEEGRGAHTYLRLCVSEIQASIEENNRTRYEDQLVRHQDCLLKLFSKMFKDELVKRLSSSHALLDIIHEKGWNWFKFHSMPISMGNSDYGDLYWIPRYTQDIKPGLVFDANELALLFKENPSKEKMKEISEIKASTLAKITRIQDGKFFWHHGGNAELVVDWTWPLFRTG